MNPSPSRLEHLVTQMKWRLQEGDGEAIYEIGVEDNGMFVGLTREELDSSLNTLNVMASKLGAHTTLLRRHVVESTGTSLAREVAEVFVRRVPDDQKVCSACKASSRAENNGWSTDNVQPDRGLDRSNSGLAGHFDRSFLDTNILFSIKLSLNAL